MMSAKSLFTKSFLKVPPNVASILGSALAATLVLVSNTNTPAWAKLVTPYADYAPSKTAFYFEFNGEDKDYQAFLKEMESNSLYQEMLTGELYKRIGASDVLSSSGLPQNSSTQSLTQLLSTYRTIGETVAAVREVYSKVIVDFEFAGAVAVWADVKIPAEGKNKTKREKTKRSSASGNMPSGKAAPHTMAMVAVGSPMAMVFNNSTPHFYAGVSLRPGRTLDGVISKWDLAKPKTIPYRPKNNPQQAVTLYFYQDMPSQKAAFYFFQDGQQIYFTDSLESVQQVLQAKQSGQSLSQNPKVSPLLAAFTPSRQGTLILQLPPEWRQAFHGLGALAEVELSAPQSKTENEEQYTERQNLLALYRKFWPVLELSDAAAVSYELHPSQQADKGHITSCKLVVQPNWAQLKDTELREDIVASLTPKSQTPFATILPEGLMISMGANNLSAPYTVLKKHILPFLPEKSRNEMLTMELGLALMGLEFEKDVIRLFDQFTGVAVDESAFSTQDLRAAVFFNGNAQGLASTDKYIKLSKDVYKAPERYKTLKYNGIPVTEILLPYREHGVRYEIPLAVAKTGSDVMAIGTKAMMQRLPGLGTTPALAQAADFQAVSQGLPGSPLAYIYVDYNRYFKAINTALANYDAQMAKTLSPKAIETRVQKGESLEALKTMEFTHQQLKQSRTVLSDLGKFYGPGSVLLSELFYDKPLNLFTLDSRFQFVLRDPKVVPDAPSPVVQEDIPQIKDKPVKKPAKRQVRRYH